VSAVRGAPDPGDRPASELPSAARELPEATRESLARVLELLASEPRAPSSVREPAEAWRVHVADSLAGLGFAELSQARTIADVGAGAGFPGLVLAAALPAARVDLIESLSRRCEFMRRAIDVAQIANARVVCERSEQWAGGDGREAYDAVTARAVGRLSTLAELASPLLREDGALVAWKGRRDPEEEAELERAGPELAMQPLEVRHVGPYAGSRNRHLHLMRKAGPTPERLPRRAGMAKKRPWGS
jgi:16S rRNA (guanine527-N7)-methyltransferase